MDILNAVFTALGSIITGVIGLVTNTFSGVTALWWTPGTGSDPGSLTVLGVFSLIAFVMGLVFFGIKFIGSMISLKSAR